MTYNGGDGAVLGSVFCHDDGFVALRQSNDGEDGAVPWHAWVTRMCHDEFSFVFLESFQRDLSKEKNY